MMDVMEFRRLMLRGRTPTTSQWIPVTPQWVVAVLPYVYHGQVMVSGKAVDKAIRPYVYHKQSMVPTKL
jgi:hypothetical protein